MVKSNIPGAKKRVDKGSVVYPPLRYYVRRVFFQYYGKVEVNGYENIPKKEPVIFAPNHQNALMDALIVLFSCGQDVVFLARSDIFRKKFLAKVLNGLKMLPVFRIRDGAAELGKNSEIFDITVDVLHRNHYLCLMPEGSHGHYRRLKPLVKGMFRIAFKAQEPKGNQSYIKIVPMGIDFQDYVKQNQDLFINYGKPIEVAEYWDQYLENPAKAINQLRNRLTEELKPLMIHIESETYYDTYMGLRTIFNMKMRENLGIKGRKQRDKFLADKEMISRLDAQLLRDEKPISEISEKVIKYLDGIKKLEIRDWVVRDKGYGFGKSLWRFFSLLITFPIFLYGFINNLGPYFLPVRMARKIKDLQFHSSVKMGLGMLVTFPVFYLLQTLLVGLLTGPWWIWVAYLLSLFPAGKFALYWYFSWKKSVRGSHFRRLVNKGDKLAVSLLVLRKEIIEDTDKVIG
ncbi:MAG: 1-acyl-sn-glycerol-3-phosphate acyltransferase [Bacteroidales bacterium]|nr:1-acyl-sn-glycerol-3-phosphate acyltransferase [Bacteroidales bacterium]